MNIARFIKDWALIICILASIASYFIYTALPLSADIHKLTNDIIAIVQPSLIFLMLLLTFCRIKPKQLRYVGWHGYLLLFQGGLFTMLGLSLILIPENSFRIEIEGAMMCLICPTATAAVVITKKLGGQIASITTYTILINILTAILIPIIAPLIHPDANVGFVEAAAKILAKVFPLLLVPLIAALAIRKLSPKLHFTLTHYSNAPFYLWLVALTLAMAITTRSIVHSTVPISTMAWLVVISLASCILQFWFGRKMGSRYNDKISAGQACGQKNTIMAIWICYTFFTPVTALVGGFYSIWHNIINSYQLYQHKKAIR